MSLDIFFNALDQGTKLDTKDSMKHEALRLASFNSRPNKYRTSASKLAHAGFFYTGTEDIVQCFSCNIQVGQWDSLGLGVDPLAIHIDRSQDCPFLQNTDKENVPFAANVLSKNSTLSLYDSPIPKIKTVLSDHSNRQLSIENDRILKQNTLVTDEIRQPETLTNQQPELVTNQRANPTTNQNSSQLSNASANTSTIPNNGEQTLSRFSPFGSGYSNSTSGHSFGNYYGSAGFPYIQFEDGTRIPPFFEQIESSAPPDPDYKDEKVRLDSFKSWSRSLNVRPNEMAKAGFYHLGFEDRVQCAFCKGVLRNWDSYDDAMEEHRKHFPTCPFIKEPHNVGNKPMKTNASEGVHIRTDKTAPDNVSLGIMTERAYHPHMATQIERINTFVNFYTDSTKTPEEFAEAGFFFTGQGDNVKCFFCDGGLRNWERNDDPWLEHARWFPKCGYLRLKKGEEYVRDIRKRFAPPGTRKPKLRKLKKKFEIDAVALETIMKSDMIQDAIDMGFSNLEIRNAVEQRLRELGTNFPNVESLTDMIYEQRAIKDDDIEWTSEEETGSEDSGSSQTGSNDASVENNESQPSNVSENKTEGGATQKTKKKKVPTATLR